MKEFTKLLIWCLVCYFLGMLLGVLYCNGKNNKYDYHINLDHNNIEILTDEGEEITIHADSLNKFIIKDNL